MLARALGRAADVTLLAPPPLERALTLEHHPAEARLLADGAPVARARPLDTALGSPPRVSYDEALAAAQLFDVQGYERDHFYPGCYVCGPARTGDDGLRIFPGSTVQPGVCAWPWTPRPSDLDERGTVDERVLWAALDCPSGCAWFAVDPDLGTIVLGRIAAVVRRRPRAGEPLVVVGWTRGAEGRKRLAGSAITSASGELLAASESTWIRLTAEQHARFAGAVPAARL